jgi:hypothetical protein
MANDPAPGEGPGAAQDAGITRTFGWQDMFVRPEDDPRTQSSSRPVSGTL